MQSATDMIVKTAGEPAHVSMCCCQLLNFPAVSTALHTCSARCPCSVWTLQCSQGLASDSHYCIPSQAPSSAVDVADRVLIPMRTSPFTANYIAGVSTQQNRCFGSISFAITYISRTPHEEELDGQNYVHIAHTGRARDVYIILAKECEGK
jgi:hypothetical protein